MKRDRDSSLTSEKDGAAASAIVEDAESTAKRLDKQWMASFPTGTAAPRIGANFQAEIPPFVPKEQRFAAACSADAEAATAQAAADMASLAASADADADADAGASAGAAASDSR